MHFTSTDEIEALRPGLDSAQRQRAFDAYTRALAAFQVAGFDESACHERAGAIALSRIDAAKQLVAICDSLYKGEWPTPGPGAPRNPYGGFASLGYPGSIQGWADAWRVYIAGIDDPDLFQAISEWLWAVDEAIPGEQHLWEVDRPESPREGNLPDAQVLSTPAAHGLDAWKEIPPGEGELMYAAPSEQDLEVLFRVYWEERLRKQIDGILRADATSQVAWSDVSEADYTVEQLARAVPKACLAWGKAQAAEKERDLTKADLKLRYKMPNGTVNINGIRAALSRLPQTKLPADVLSKAKTELENALAAAKKDLGIEDRSDGREPRIDQIDEIQVVRHDEDLGLLTVDMTILKFQVLPYRDASGEVVMEALLPKDYATPAYLSTIPGKPITDLHPAAHFRGYGVVDELSPKEQAARTYGIHHLDDRAHWVDGDRIRSRATLFEPSLIQDVLLGGRREVSAGRLAAVIDEQGDFAGRHYARRQTNPIHDHTAFVPKGRCGPECAVVLDGAIQVDESTTGGTMTQETKKGKAGAGNAPPEGDARTLQIADATDETKSMQIALPPEVKDDDAKAFQARIDEILQANTDAVAKVDELTKEVERLTGAKDGANDELAALKQQVAELKTGQTALDDGFDARVDERAEMIAVMRELVPDYAHRGKSIVDMQRDALQAHDPELDLEGKSDEYIAGRFEQLQAAQAEPVGARTLRSTEDESDDGEENPRTSMYRDPTKAKKPAAPSQD